MGIPVRAGATSEAIISLELILAVVAAMPKRKRLRVLTRVTDAVGEDIIIPMATVEKVRLRAEIRAAWTALLPQLLDP